MNKYSSFYLSEVFKGIQKLARSYGPEAIESLRRGSTDPGITPGEREAYARAYAKATKATANGTAPRPTAAAAAPPPNAAPRPTAAAAAPPPNAAPRPTTGGASNAGFGPKVPGFAAPAVNPSLWKQVMKVPLKGNLLGAGLQIAGDYTIPKFEGDGFWAGMGNEARDFAIAAGSGAAGAGLVSGGALAEPGAVSGAAFHTLGKVYDAGKALYDLNNYKLETANNTKKHEAFTGKSQAQMKAELERGKRLRAEARASATAAPPPASTATAAPPIAQPIPPVAPPVAAFAPPTTPIPVATNTGSVAPAAAPTGLPPTDQVAVPPPVTTTSPASPPVSVPAPLTPQSNNLTPKQRMDKITVERSRAQRGKALEYAGLDPKAPPQRFSGFAPPTQQPTETNSFLPQSNPQVSQPKPVAQPPTRASSPGKFNVVTGPRGIAVGGNVFDKLKADGKVPKDFQLTKAMRTGEEPLPPEIQAAKDEFIRGVKKDVTMSDSGLTPANPLYNRKRIG